MRRNRKAKPNIIGDIIRQKMKALGKEDYYLEAVVKNHWDEIVGKAIANQTENVYFHKKMLYVKLKSPMIKSTLIGLKEKYKDIINDYVNKHFIDAVVFH